MVDRALLRIDSVITPSGTSTNILSFSEEHVMQSDIRLVPNVYEGIAMKYDHRWRELTLIFDSDTDIFDAYIDDDGPNPPIGSLQIDMTMIVIATQAQVTERWVYCADKCYVMDKREGEIEEGRERQTFEYRILCYDDKSVTWP